MAISTPTTGASSSIQSVIFTSHSKKGSRSALLRVLALADRPQ
jgi:hypothetical protein